MPIEYQPGHNHNPTEFCGEDCPMRVRLSQVSQAIYQELHNHDSNVECFDGCPQYEFTMREPKGLIAELKDSRIEFSGTFDAPLPPATEDNTERTSEKDSFIPGMNIIREMSREDMIAEIMHHQQAHMNTMPLDHLKAIVIDIRCTDYKKRLFEEAEMDGHRPWGMMFGRDDD